MSGDTTVFVPRETRWPAFFAATISRPWKQLGSKTNLMIVSRSGPSATWRLAESIDLFSPSGPVILSAPAVDADGYDVIDQPALTPPARWLGDLAAYYGSWKDTGRAPGNDLFSTGQMTTGKGRELTTNHQGTVLDDGGVTVTYRFAAPSLASQWVFGARGAPISCGSVLEYATYRPVAGLLHQSADRQGWGATIAPGSCSSIVTTFDYPVCVFEDFQSGASLGVIGDPDVVSANVGYPPSRVAGTVTIEGAGADDASEITRSPIRPPVARASADSCRPVGGRNLSDGRSATFLPLAAAGPRNDSTTPAVAGSRRSSGRR